MKKIIVALALSLSMCLCAIMIGCGVTTYTVSFVVDGLTVSSVESAGGDVSLPTAPTKANHKFSGWYVDGVRVEGDVYAYDGSGDVSVEAKWESQKYAIYRVGGVEYYRIAGYSGDVLTMPTAPTHPSGGQFCGWYIGAQKYDGSTYAMADSDVYFDAKYQDTYYIYYDYLGYEIESAYATTGDVLTMPTIPERNGYRILGWVDSLGVVYAVGSTLVIDGPTLLTQEYKAEYAVRYRYFDGTTVTDGDRYLSGETITLPNLIHIDGLTARGWYDGSLMYEAGETYTVLANTILSAKYTEDAAPQLIYDEIDVNFATDDPFRSQALNIANGNMPTLLPYLETLADTTANVWYRVSANPRAYLTGYGMEIDGMMVEIFTFKTVPVYYNGQFVDDNYAGGIIVYPISTSLGAEAPGVLNLHGGGGGVNGSTITTALRWAEEGYVYCAIDLIGIGDPSVMVMSSGTHLNVAYGSNRFVVQPSVEASMIYVSVSCGMSGFNILYNSGLVDKDKVGVYGVSWGGYMTTYLTGALGSMVQVGSATYGCGFYDYEGAFNETLDAMTSEDRETWLKYLDAGRRAKGVKGYYYVGAATNDNWFRPGMIESTVCAMPNAKGVGWAYEPNVGHTLPTLPSGTDYFTRGKGNMLADSILMDYYLKNKGYAPSTIEYSVAPHKNADGDLEAEITFTMDSRCELNTSYVKAYYAEQPNTGTTTPWHNKIYRDMSDCLTRLTASEGVYVYKLVVPAEIARLGVDYFVTLCDSGDSRDIRQFALSTHMLNSGGLGIA